MPTPEELAKLLEENGLKELKDSIPSTATPCYKLEPLGEIMDDLPIASSKVGGLPHLPADFAWPTKGKRPLMFLAQINLSNLPRDHVPDNPLPKSGLLTFWYDTAAMPWGFDPKDAGAFQVHHITTPSDLLHARNPPEFVPDGLKDEPQSPWTPFNECELRIQADYTYNWDPDEAIERISDQVEDDKADELYKLFMDFHEEQMESENDSVHQLLGNPLQIQGDMETQCQLVSNGIYLGGPPPESEKAKIESLKQNAKDWRLLLQLDSDHDAADWMWGDCGKLYFWIKKQDLQAANFIDGWGVLQCY